MEQLSGYSTKAQTHTVELGIGKEEFSSPENLQAFAAVFLAGQIFIPRAGRKRILSLTEMIHPAPGMGAEAWLSDPSSNLRG